MAMAHQAEFHSTLIRSENAAPEPTSEHDVAVRYLETMFDDYVTSVRELPETYTYVSGYETDYRLTQGSSRLPIYTSIPKHEIIEARLDDLDLFVNGTLETGALLLSSKDIEQNELMTKDDIVGFYITTGIARAEARYAALHEPEEESDVPEETQQEDVELKYRFVDVLKNMGTRAVSVYERIEVATPLFSRPIDIVNATPKEEEEPNVVRGYDKASV